MDGEWVTKTLHRNSHWYWCNQQFTTVFFFRRKCFARFESILTYFVFRPFQLPSLGLLAYLLIWLFLFIFCSRYQEWKRWRFRWRPWEKIGKNAGKIDHTTCRKNCLDQQNNISMVGYCQTNETILHRSPTLHYRQHAGEPSEITCCSMLKTIMLVFSFRKFMTWPHRSQQWTYPMMTRGKMWTSLFFFADLTVSFLCGDQNQCIFQFHRFQDGWNWSMLLRCAAITKLTATGTFQRSITRPAENPNRKTSPIKIDQQFW